MEQKCLEEFREDLKEFHEMTRMFYAKEITVPEYKGFSGGFGSYAQRGGERSMLRLRLAGGEINMEKLKFLADSVKKYDIDLVHFTTCQTVQMHNLTEETVCRLIEEAFDNGIITRGGGGDFPRNVMCSPLSGVEEGEYFNVLPCAREAADYMLTFIKKVKLRLSPEQGLYIINLTSEEAKKVLAITEDGANTTFERSTACIGADICQVGIGRARILLQECVARVKKENFADGVLPAIHISGCPSSCGTHQTAAIGLRGGKKPTPEGPKFAFAVYENGCETAGKEAMGTEIGVMLEDEIPQFFVELGRAVEETGLTYAGFRREYPDKFMEIVARYI